MYLPQTQIDAMLRRCGYPAFDGGLVSSTYGVQKRSGKLFRQFCMRQSWTQDGCYLSGTAGGRMWPVRRWPVFRSGICRCRRSLRMP